jgi:hypothetical protein
MLIMVAMWKYTPDDGFLSVEPVAVAVVLLFQLSDSACAMVAR